MALLQNLPTILISPADLLGFGTRWQINRSLPRTPPNSSSELGRMIDLKVGSALAVMLGSIPVVTPTGNALVPLQSDCVEVGPVRVVGGVRPQNFDVGYRPDGLRIAFDSKTLNDKKSVGKNYQNMINDLATEATTVHARFPFAIVAFMVVIPTPCLVSPHKESISFTLERMSDRSSPQDTNHKAEVISLVLWDPQTGIIDPNWPHSNSILRIEKFSQKLEQVYFERYKGLPPHNE
jgi:hypothetical protein